MLDKMKEAIPTSESREVRETFKFDQDNKWFHRFSIVAKGGVIGNCYFPKGAEIPMKIILNYEKQNEVFICKCSRN